MNLTAKQIIGELINEQNIIKSIQNEMFTDKDEDKNVSFWVTSKDHFINRLITLPTLYHRDVWNYLQAYIIRGVGNFGMYNVCNNVYKQSGILACSIGMPNMVRNLNISEGKVKQVLREMDINNLIIKYISKNKRDTNNTNIYILGFENVDKNKDTPLTQREKYFIDADNKMTKNQRDKIIKLYNKQLGIEQDINDLTNGIREIQHEMFGRDGSI